MNSILHLKRCLRGPSYDDVLNAIAFEQRSVVVYGKEYPQPRLTKWYAPVPYEYSRLRWEPCEMPPLIEQLRKDVEKSTGGRFNSVLCNLYRDEQDTVSWHSDDETFLGKDPEIASLSFGSARKFQLKNKKTDERIEYVLEDGDLLYMGRGVQSEWMHRVPRENKVTGPRINLTFRYAIG